MRKIQLQKDWTEFSDTISCFSWHSLRYSWSHALCLELSPIFSSYRACSNMRTKGHSVILEIGKRCKFTFISATCRSIYPLMVNVEFFVLEPQPQSFNMFHLLYHWLLQEHNYSVLASVLPTNQEYYKYSNVSFTNYMYFAHLRQKLIWLSTVGWVTKLVQYVTAKYLPNIILEPFCIFLGVLLIWSLWKKMHP